MIFLSDVLDFSVFNWLHLGYVSIFPLDWWTSDLEMSQICYQEIDVDKL